MHFNIVSYKESNYLPFQQNNGDFVYQNKLIIKVGGTHYFDAVSLK